ncbi:MAG TPA: ABC transporter permease, partial [Chitinophagaceae bacterium]|nr:ABC transporter permease [Chitinophagaceae bacterium]
MAYKHIHFIVRRFWRHKLTTFLHIIGLTLGISACLLIGLFIRHETSFDMYHAKADRIWRVNQVWIDDGKKDFHFSTPFPLADAIRSDISGIENVTKVHHPFNSIIEINPLKRFKEDYLMMTDPEFLDVFDVKVLEGNAHEALREPNRALLTESTAKKYYGTEDPVGKVFKFNNKYDITVAGVIADFPGNTHLPANILLSFSSDEGYLRTSTKHYGSVSGGSTFIVLPKGAKADARLLASLNGIYERNVNHAPWMRKTSSMEMELQPLSDIHFNSKYAGGGQWVKAINKSWLWFFGSVGLAVLVLACINFVNLSTAQAITRAKEVGVRKTVGAGKFQLIMQFLQEALLLVFIAGILGIIITKIALPYINELTGKEITFDVFHSYLLLGSLLGGILLTALLAGFYPAWLITKFHPATTLKSGSVNSNPQSALLRKGLVITQFSISVCLLIAVLLIGKQMNYMRTKDLGFDKDNILLVDFPGDKPAKKELFHTALLQDPQVKNISFSTSPPSGDERTHWGTVMSVIGNDDPNMKRVTTIMADDQFCPMYKMHLLAGRFPVTGDTAYVSNSLPEGQRFAKSVVNEELIKTMGFGTPEASLGKKFWIGMNGWTAEVIGVVSDFNTASLRDAITPTLITQYADFAEKVSIKINKGADIPAVISTVEATYKKIFPESIFQFKFLDEQLDALYKTEERLYRLFEIFSTLAILISCLGLWGLVTFAAQRRVKEIGIRKVLGASV